MNRLRLTVLVAVLLVAAWWLLRPEPREIGPAPSIASSDATPARARAPARAQTDRPPTAAAAVPPAVAPHAALDDVCKLRGVIHGGEPAEMVWTDEIGAPCDPNDALLAMDVVDEQGLAAEDAWIMPVDCEGLEPGPPRVTRVPSGRCTVRAVRRDGALFARSEPVTVDVAHDDAGYVQLELASTRTGGIGVRFAPDDAGIRVLDVVEGSPAEEAGLHPGDLVLDVGGVPTEGMDADTFVEHMTGAENTDVTFTVGWADDTGMVRETVTVVRQFLDG